MGRRFTWCCSNPTFKLPFRGISRQTSRPSTGRSKRKGITVARPFHVDRQHPCRHLLLLRGHDVERITYELSALRTWCMQKVDAASWPEAETHYVTDKESSCKATAHVRTIVCSKGPLFQGQICASEGTSSSLTHHLVPPWKNKSLDILVPKLHFPSWLLDNFLLTRRDGRDTSSEPRNTPPPSLPHFPFQVPPAGLSPWKPALWFWAVGKHPLGTQPRPWMCFICEPQQKRRPT